MSEVINQGFDNDGNFENFLQDTGLGIIKKMIPSNPSEVSKNFDLLKIIYTYCKNTIGPKIKINNPYFVQFLVDSATNFHEYLDMYREEETEGKITQEKYQTWLKEGEYDLNLEDAYAKFNKSIIPAFTIKEQPTLSNKEIYAEEISHLNSLLSKLNSKLQEKI